LKKIAISELRKMTAEQLKESPALEVTADGEHVGFLIIDSESVMRERIAAQASQIDAGRGK
jgi:hypothetical protein